MIAGNDIKNQMKITKTIYFALIMGLLLFFFVAILFIQTADVESNKELDDMFTILVPVFGLFMMFLSRFIYTKKIADYDVSKNLIQKLADFRTFRIIMWAIIEGACFLSLVAIMATANYLHVVVFIFLFGYFILVRPTKESFIQDMRLTMEESDIILKS